MDAPRGQSVPSGDRRSTIVTRPLRSARTPHQWGRIDSWPTAHGAWARRRLTVYPPGTTRSQRQALEFHHNWPVVGALTMIFGTVLLGRILSPATAAVLSAAIYVLVGVVSSRVTRALRLASRSIEVSAMSIGNGWSITGDLGLFEALRSDLVTLTADRESGQLSPVDFEARWADAFRQISNS